MGLFVKLKSGLRDYSSGDLIPSSPVRPNSDLPKKLRISHRSDDDGGRRRDSVSTISTRFPLTSSDFAYKQRHGGLRNEAPSLLLLSISVGSGSSDSFRQQKRTNRRRRRRRERRLLERGSDEGSNQRVGGSILGAGERNVEAAAVARGG